MARHDLRIIYKKRPTSPFGPSGGMTYHHTIPANVLRDFWNDFLTYNFDEFRTTFVRPFAVSLCRYPVCPGDPDGNAAFTTTVGGILKQIVSGAVTHNPTAPEPANWGWLHQAYIWIPGNLFHGPSNRAKGVGLGCDPEERFDTFASRCMPQGQYNMILHAYRSIEAYRRAEMGTLEGNRAARGAGQALASLANLETLTPYNENHWRGVILAPPIPK